MKYNGHCELYNLHKIGHDIHTKFHEGWFGRYVCMYV
jgi:hypothetical protein